jgi:hypothetical protein
LDNLTMYYRDGYDAVRKHSSTAFCMIWVRVVLWFAQS